MIILLCLLTYTIKCDLLTCQSTPYNTLSKCNITCNICNPSNIKLCQSCPQDLLLNNSQCFKQTTSQIYYVSSLKQAKFSTELIKNFTIDQLSCYNICISLQYPSNILVICGANTYKFDMIGPFKQDNFLNFNYVFNKDISSMQVRFKLLSFVNNIRVTISVNGDQFHLQDLQANNITTFPINNTNIIQIPALTQATVDNLLINIISSRKKISFSNLNLGISVVYLTNRTQQTPIWSIKDLTLITKACQNCITFTLNGLSIRLGTAIGIVGAILVALVAILCITVKLDEKSSNNNSKYSIGDNRVITKLKNDYKSIQRSTKKLKLT